MHIKSLLVSLIFFTLFSVESLAQTNKTTNLVFEGAGIRGIAYAGTLKSFEKHGITQDISKVGGTSAGAITSILFALGYGADEMGTIIANTKFQKFNDGKFFFVGGIARTKNNYGWYRGDEFTSWIGELIKSKTGSSETTFEQLYSNGYKDLYITATCLNKQKLIVLSRLTYPNMKLKDAVRISMSIPLYFQAVLVDSLGNIYFEQDEKHSFDLMVDGGIVGNFPIQIFDSTYTDSSNNIVRVPNYHTLGIRIDSDSQIKEDSLSHDLAPYPINNFSDYMTAFYLMVIENLNRYSLTEVDWMRTISVSSVGIGPKIKKLSKAQKELLIKSGYDGAETYFNKSKK